MVINKVYKYYYLYRILNVLENKEYIGVHATDDLADGYMGSGVYLERAKNVHGIENFKKEILEFFDNERSMYQREAEIVNEEFVRSDSNYNIALGGNGGNTGNYDSLERSSALSAASIGKIMAKDKDGAMVKVHKDDHRWKTGELVGSTKNIAVMKDSVGNIVRVDVNDSRIKTGELVGVSKGVAVMRDKNGNVVTTSIDDPRIKTGELVGVTAGCKQPEERNRRRSQKLNGRTVRHTYASCVVCKKTTILTNLIRWHQHIE